MRTPTRFIGFGWGLGLALGACLLASCKDDETHEPVELSCNMDNNGAALEGDWVLHASGKRTECKDRRWEGDFSLDSEMPISVDSKAQKSTGDDESDEVVPGEEAAAFLERIERADFEVSLKDTIDDFELTGTSLGSCVSFTIRESYGVDGEATYVFEGQINDTTYVQGNFHGDGPKGCTTEGTFSIDIR